MNAIGNRFQKLAITRSVLLAIFLGCGTGALIVEIAMPREAVAQVVDDSYFYEGLAPYGEWYFQADFGWVWRPLRVAVNWRPYTEGQWVWADEVGWTWASDEPWGWATYHYGRWYFDPIYGWTWVPGRTWAPAWVDWRIESGYVGWAPLWPVYFDVYPEYRWDHWGYDNDWDHRHRGRDWDRWVFCRDRDFTSPRISRVMLTDRGERDRIYQRSRDVTRWDGDSADRIGYSIDRSTIERAAAHPIRHVRLENADRPARGALQGDRFQVFRPRIEERTDRTPDSLGIAKAPREIRQADTIKQEKARLDRVPGREKSAITVQRGPREKDNERGGAPELIDREDNRRGFGTAGTPTVGTSRGEATGRDRQATGRDRSNERLWPTGEQEETHGRGEKVAPGQERVAPRGRGETTPGPWNQEEVSPRGDRSAGVGEDRAPRGRGMGRQEEVTQPSERTHGATSMGRGDNVNRRESASRGRSVEMDRPSPARIERSERQPVQRETPARRPEREAAPQQQRLQQERMQQQHLSQERMPQQRFQQERIPQQRMQQHMQQPRMPQSEPRMMRQSEPRVYQGAPRTMRQNEPRPMQTEPRMQRQSQPAMQQHFERGPASQGFGQHAPPQQPAQQYAPSHGRH